MEEEIFEKLKKIIAEQFGIDEIKITKDSILTDDLAADSLDIVELVMNIEENFNIQIAESDAERIVTVGDMVKYIQSVVRGITKP